MSSRPALSAALYARVSTDKQAQQKTVASQVEALRERARADGAPIEPEREFVDDGCSGAILDRPALERLRDQAALGGIDRVYVHSPDRLARRLALQMVVLDELKRHGVDVVFLNQPKVESAEDSLLLNIQGALSEYERTKILERSRRGKLHAARRGAVGVLSKAPFGYRYVPKSQTGADAKFEIDDAHAGVVREMFAWAGVERCPLTEIVRRLKTKRIPSPSGKSDWSRSTVYNLLRNAAYCGQAAYGKTCRGPQRPRLRAGRGKPLVPRRPGSVYRTEADKQIVIAIPPLVDAGLFASVAQQLRDNASRARQQRHGARWLLQGLVVCAECGYAFYGSGPPQASGKAYRYYRCSGTDKARFGGHRQCANRTLDADWLDDQVWNDAVGLLGKPTQIEREFRRRLEVGARPTAIHQQQLHEQIAKAGKAVARLVDAYAAGHIDRDLFEPRIVRARERHAALQKERQTLDAAQQNHRDLAVVAGRLADFARSIGRGLRRADWQRRRDILTTLVRHIEAAPECVKIVYKIEDFQKKTPTTPPILNIV